MNRKNFISTYGSACLGLTGLSLLLGSCTGTKYLDGILSESFLEIPLNAFEIIKKDQKNFRKYVVVQHSKLQYPICVYRLSATEYLALWMRCTHQGTELRAYGDRLQCPAHGSEFTKNGAVQNGPAETNLRQFPVHIEADKLKINLA